MEPLAPTRKIHAVTSSWLVPPRCARVPVASAARTEKATAKAAGWPVPSRVSSASPSNEAWATAAAMNTCARATTMTPRNESSSPANSAAR